MTLTPRKETTPNTGHHLGGRSGGDSGSQGSDGGHQADQVGDPEGLHPMLPANLSKGKTEILLRLRGKNSCQLRAEY